MGRLEIVGGKFLSPKAITPERITEMWGQSPRRMSLAEYKAFHSDKGNIGLNQPQPPIRDWNLAFPFRESFTTAFELVFGLEHIPFQAKRGVNLTYTFLKEVNEQDLDGVREWLASIDRAVGIRDCLVLSFAMDYERELGKKGNPQTEIGGLRSLAKPYDHQPTPSSIRAADTLAVRLAEFIRACKFYNSATTLVAVPPSSPNKPFDLPAHLVAKLADHLGWENLSAEVRTSRERGAAKSLKVEDKLAAIEGTIEVTPGAFKGKVVTLVDDLYQSGTTMNYVGMLLQQAGARAIFGLACEKTLRNDDNVQDG
jgi:hypothetical protein